VAEQEALRAKFELGPHEWTRTLDAREKAQTIPWGYGRDRVTAMAVDPDRLFVYWEVTDEAIAAARARLGADAAGTLLLRVHDVTGLLFDGDNSHHSFDLEVGRAERQRFHWIGRPTSSVIVELGLRGGAGFAAIARSGRVDFPRRDPAPAGPVEWLTVREVRSDARGAERLDVAPAPPPVGVGGHLAAVADSPPAWPGCAEVVTTGPAATDDPVQQWQLTTEHFDEWFAGSFGELAFDFDGQRFDWLGPREESVESGPGEWQPLAVPAAQVERHGGDWLVEQRGGSWRVVQAPWSLAIRGVGARGARRLLSRWELRRSWIIAAGWLGAPRDARRLRARDGGRPWLEAGTAAGSESRLEPGASERRFLAASELRLGGASEERLVGGSERRLGGQAARELGGASESLATRSFTQLPPPLDRAWPSDGTLR